MHIAFGTKTPNDYHIWQKSTKWCISAFGTLEPNVTFIWHKSNKYKKGGK